MSKSALLKNFSVSQRLWILAGAAVIGSVSITGVSLYNGLEMRQALAVVKEREEQLKVLSDMRFQAINIGLNAMDTMIDREEGKVQPERVAETRTAFTVLETKADVLHAMAEAIGQPALDAQFRDDVASLRQAVEVDLTRLVETHAPWADYAPMDDAVDGTRERVANVIAEVEAGGKELVTRTLNEVEARNMRSISIQMGVGLAAMLAVLALQMGIGATIRRGIGAVCDSMKRIAAGQLDTPVPETDRGDEIGEMARATEVFRMAARDKLDIERQADTERQRAETERRDRDSLRQADSDAVTGAVAALAEGLNRLAEGDLTVSIDTPFRADLERLRIDFNQTTTRLNAALAAVRQNTLSIQANSNQMRSSTDDLSRRTEQQAAALEETSAALDEITATVRSAAERAEEAGHMVEGTKKNTEHSGTVVRDAMAAMGRIEDASREIGKIINVIDEIAFQTNLLALNAGVEAARAGEAGKGFAVVAQEVRELASRAAGAAKDIKALITKSGDEVRTGVELVTATGEALQQIGADVLRINNHVASIITSAREQTTGLTEINHAVGQMDQVTQKNAAMVEESNAVSHSLATDANSLAELIGQFRTRSAGGDALPRASQPRAAAESARPAPSPAKALMSRVTGAFARTATAEKPQPTTDKWEEF